MKRNLFDELRMTGRLDSIRGPVAFVTIMHVAGQTSKSFPAQWFLDNGISEGDSFVIRVEDGNDLTRDVRILFEKLEPDLCGTTR